MVDEDASESTPITEVEITVGGHTICVKAAAPMADVAAQALGLYQQTQLEARKIKFGFDVTASQVELRDQPDHGWRMEETEGPEEDRARMGRVDPEGTPTGRLA